MKFRRTSWLRVKFRVGRIGYAALSRDETLLGFVFPKEERSALIASAPEKFLMPRPSDEVRDARTSGFGTAGRGMSGRE